MLSLILILLVAAIHIWILVIEMFLWTRPIGRKVFGTSAEFAAASRVMAANQGLYNGFLAAGLLLALALGAQAAGEMLLLFTLGCVVAAGLYGAATVSRRIIYVQALPAGLALAAHLAGP